MKKIIMRCLAAIAGIYALILVTQIGRYGGVVSNRYSGDGFEVIEAFPPTKLLAVHSDYPRLLIRGQQKFENLQGSFPYFISVPQLRSILFLVGSARHPEEAFVVLDLVSGHAIEIPLGGVIVGSYGIGRSGEAATTVKSASPTIIVLQDDSMVYHVDLEKHLVTSSRKSDAK